MSRFTSIFPRVLASPFLARRWVRYSLFGLFYFFCFFVFVRLTFPYGALKDRIVAEYNGSQKERRISIEEMGGHFLFGVKASGVSLVDLAPPMPGAPEQEKKKPLEIENLRVSPSLFSYLLGSTVVHFSADLGGGELNGTFEQSEEEAKIVLHGEEIELGGLTLLESIVGLPMTGVLSVDSEILLPERKAQKAEGKFELTITELSIGDGKAKIRNTIALPKLNAGELKLNAKVTAGRMEVTEFSANGTDFDLNGEGRIRLREPFDKSALDLELGFKFKDAYVNKSDMTKTIFGSPDGKVPGLFEMDPQVRSSKAADGYYRWRVGGLLAHPSFRPSGGSGLRKPSSPKGGAEAE